jgi:NADPH2:quinone reductase
VSFRAHAVSRGYNDEQILIRVVVAGANPKDWKHPDPNYFVSLALALYIYIYIRVCVYLFRSEYLVHTFVFPAQNSRINQGDDIAGYVHELGRHVRGFSVGDRVAAFHQIGTAGGSYAEYAVAWKHTTFHIPDDLSFEAVSFSLIVHSSSLGVLKSYIYFIFVCWCRKRPLRFL